MSKVEAISAVLYPPPWVPVGLNTVHTTMPSKNAEQIERHTAIETVNRDGRVISISHATLVTYDRFGNLQTFPSTKSGDNF